MEIEDIQAFVAVADAGGLSSAAGRLGVSKSIVSRRLARLEKSLGATLLTRNINEGGVDLDYSIITIDLTVVS